jgi:hypothetical protein
MHESFKGILVCARRMRGQPRPMGATELQPSSVRVMRCAQDAATERRLNTTRMEHICVLKVRPTSWEMRPKSLEIGSTMGTAVGRPSPQWQWLVPVSQTSGLRRKVLRIWRSLYRVKFSGLVIGNACIPLGLVIGNACIPLGLVIGNACIPLPHPDVLCATAGLIVASEIRSGCASSSVARNSSPRWSPGRWLPLSLRATQSPRPRPDPSPTSSLIN